MDYPINNHSMPSENARQNAKMGSARRKLDSDSRRITLADQNRPINNRTVWRTGLNPDTSGDQGV
jgi:hypothetical protein